MKSLKTQPANFANGKIVEESSSSSSSSSDSGTTPSGSNTVSQKSEAKKKEKDKKTSVPTTVTVSVPDTTTESGLESAISRKMSPSVSVEDAEITPAITVMTGENITGKVVEEQSS